MKTPDIDYQTTAITQTRAARESAAKAGAEKLAAAKVQMDAVRLNEIGALNSLREAGLQFNVASGRAQLIFDLAGIEFARKQILPHMPEGITIEHLRLCVHLAKRLPEPVRTIEEVRGIKREAQTMFTLFGIADAPSREKPQTPHQRNLFASAINRICVLRKDLEALAEEAPVETWADVELDSFIESADPVFRFLQGVRQHRLSLSPTPGMKASGTQTPLT